MPSNGNQRHGIKLWVRDATCEGEADVPGEGAGDLAGILAGLPDQIMAVLLAFLCFKTFLEMVK
jgi:hypothetical protein